MLHYIITNREIIPDEKGEFIKADGGETPSENLRFGTFDSDIYNATKTLPYLFLKQQSMLTTAWASLVSGITIKFPHTFTVLTVLV